MSFSVDRKSDNSVIHKNNVEQGSRSQKNKTDIQWRWIWIHLIICIVHIVCTTILMYAIVTWTLSAYFHDYRSQLPTEDFYRDQRDASSFQGNFSAEEKLMLAGTTNASSAFFVERNGWGGMPPAGPLEKLELPVAYVIISHTATELCTTKSECTFQVRFTQTFHIESRKWSDIAYNFLAGGDGLIYVGRGWDNIGAHSFNFNKKSIGITFIGTFNTLVPPQSQLDAVQKLIQLGVETGKISPDYKLLGQRQISKSLSPGDALYEIIKKWPHWSPDV